MKRHLLSYSLSFSDCDRRGIACVMFYASAQSSQRFGAKCGLETTSVALSRRARDARQTTVALRASTTRAEMLKKILPVRLY